MYNLLLLIGTLILLPKWLLQKKYQGSRLQRLGFNLPPKSLKTPVIWIHMVSMGETRAMIPIYQSLREKHPNAAFFLSNTTKTGQEEAKRSLPNADHYFFLPLDFSWVMNRLGKAIKPDLFLLSESDFWPNLLKALKSQGTKIVLLNGKISNRSHSRFKKLPLFSKSIFNGIDHFCVQNQIYADRFLSLGIPKDKITVTGNLKLSIPTPILSASEKAHWRAHFGLKATDRVITVASTHPGEEELILPQIANYKILLVPRHPERHASLQKKFTDSKIFLVTEMGILPICYQLSELAILGGSFIPGIGGHNVYEPLQSGIPVIFGPFMDNQQELADIVLSTKSALQVPIEYLRRAIENPPKSPLHPISMESPLNCVEKTKALEI